MHLRKTLITLFFLLLLAVFLGLTRGAVNIPLAGLFLEDNRAILGLRLLRIFSAIIAGSGLAVCGIALQAILRNPLAEPYLLGTSTGAGLGAVIALILGISQIYLSLAAFLGAILSIIIVYALASERGRISEKSLILSGVIVSIALSALIVFFVTLFGDKIWHEITWWLWGSLQVYDFKLIIRASIPVFAGIFLIYLFAQDLNALSLGEEEAMHLGIDAQNIKKILILICSLVTASIICISGVIGFVGLIVPHIMRITIGPNHKALIPATCIAASIFMIICDVVSRTVFAPIEIPIGVVTALIGAPIFIILLKKGKRS